MKRHRVYHVSWARVALGLTLAEWKGIKEAAADCHLPVRDYCRLMLLCAAGFGGAQEHIERAIAASWDASAQSEQRKKSVQP